MRARNILITLQVQGKSVTVRIFINVLVCTHGVCPLQNMQCPGIAGLSLLSYSTMNYRIIPTAFEFLEHIWGLNVLTRRFEIYHYLGKRLK